METSKRTSEMLAIGFPQNTIENRNILPISVSIVKIEICPSKLQKNGINRIQYFIYSKRNKPELLF